MSDALETSIMCLPLKTQGNGTDAQDIARAQIRPPRQQPIVQIGVIAAAQILCDIRILSLIDTYMMMGYKIIRKYNIVVGAAPDCELVSHGKAPPREPLARDDEEGRCALLRLGQTRRLFDIPRRRTPYAS